MLGSHLTWGVLSCFIRVIVPPLGRGFCAVIRRNDMSTGGAGNGNSCIQSRLNCVISLSIFIPIIHHGKELSSCVMLYVIILSYVFIHYTIFYCNYTFPLDLTPTVMIIHAYNRYKNALFLMLLYHFYCNYSFLLDLTPNGFPFGAKSFSFSLI